MREAERQKQEILERCAPFAGVQDGVRERLARTGRLLEAERRERLFAQGDGAEDLLVIGAGRVRLFRTGRGEREVTLAYRGPGEIAGETGWVDGTHPAEGRAAEPVVALRLPWRRLTAELAREPRLAVAFFELVCRRVRELEDRIEALLTRPVESRVAAFLLDAAARHGVPDPRGQLIGVKFTHREIASYVGSTRETVTLVLGELKRRGLLTTDRRRVVVSDPKALEALV